MNCARKTLPLLVATLAPFFASPAGAVGLGELITHSALGEGLRAEIRLSLGPGEVVSANCFKSVGRSGDDLPWLSGVSLTLAGERLILTTRAPVNHPIAMLGLYVGCGTELRRDYPLMLQPPSVRLAHPVVEALPPPPAEEAGSAAPLPNASRPAPRRPASTAPAALPRAAAPVARRSAAETVPPDARKPPPRPTPQRAAAPLQRDRLMIGAGDEARLVPLQLAYELANPPRSDAPIDKARPPLPPEQRTLLEIDERIAAQLELDEKIKRLEEYQALLKERVAQLDRSPSVRPPAAPPAAPAAAAPPPPAAGGLAENLPPLPEMLAGLLGLLGGAGALLWLRRRRQAQEEAPLTEVPVNKAPRPPAPPSLFPFEPAPTTIGRTVVVPPEPADQLNRDMPQRRPPQPAVAVTAATTAPPSGGGPDWSEQTFAPAHPIPFDETVDEQDSALELAEIMMSFGRTQGAAETLADYIRNNPRHAVKPWLKLLEVYHVAGMRAEFEALTRQLNKTFNVKMVSWSDFKMIRSALDSLEQIPHVTAHLQQVWGTQEAQAYIHQILRDNRNGTRLGFPLAVVEELLLLLAILDDELGTYKPPPIELTLADMEPPKDAA